MLFLGNQTIQQLEERTGWTFSDEEREWLTAHRQDNATVRRDSDRFHIFDIPFYIQMGLGAEEEIKSICQSKGASKETLMGGVASETEEEKWEKKREAMRIESQKKKADPNKKWLAKWHMTIPIGEGYEYGLFVNTPHKGYMNIPENINGTFWVKYDEEGLHGRFASNEDDGYVIGVGVYKNGYLTSETRLFEFSGRIEDYFTDRELMEV